MKQPLILTDIKAAKHIFNEYLLDDSGYAVTCIIHSYFHSNNSEAHNCIGCNLAASIMSIKSFLCRVDYYENVEELYTDFIIKLYLFVERAQTIFSIITLPEKYEAKHFESFQEIRKWANFIKHPKAFMFCHDPQYYVADKAPKIEFNLRLDTNNIKRFYSDESKNTALYKKLSNKNKVAVIYPTAKSLMEGFTKEVLKLISVIENNEIIREALNEKSTIEDYFDQKDDAS